MSGHTLPIGALQNVYYTISIKMSLLRALKLICVCLFPLLVHLYMLPGLIQPDLPPV